MKALKFFVFVGCCFAALNTFAQTPDAIEADLLQSLKNIDFTSQDNVKANNEFGKKLKNYTEKYPSTISQDFPLLRDAHMDISTSGDGLFRIYSWDTWTSDILQHFENVFQFKVGAKVSSATDAGKTGYDWPNFDKVYTFKTKQQTYYLAVYLAVGSIKGTGQGIQIFDIENGQLNQDLKIIKTPTGFHSQLKADYDFGTVVDWSLKPTIYFDAVTQTIHLPIVKAQGNVVHQATTYKFNGKYFEEVK